MTDDGTRSVVATPVPRRWAIRGAAIVLWINGFGFGLFDLFPLWSLSTGGGVPIIFGYPTYGAGPFEQHGVPTSVPLLLLFLGVCVLEIVAGSLLWRRRRTGAVLGLVVVLPGAVFWWGFALPVAPVLAAVRVALIGWGWSALQRGSGTINSGDV